MIQLFSVTFTLVISPHLMAPMKTDDSHSLSVSAHLPPLYLLNQLTCFYETSHVRYIVGVYPAVICFSYLKSVIKSRRARELRSRSDISAV